MAKKKALKQDWRKVGQFAVGIFIATVLLFLTGIGIQAFQPLLAQQSSFANDARPIPARTIPVPSTVSPELQKAIAQPLMSSPRVKLMQYVPKTSEEWKKLIAGFDKASFPVLEQMRQAFPVQITSANIAGVKTYTITPESIAEENLNRVLVHLHGGGYFFHGGELTVKEAIPIAYYGKIKVISVDYRALLNQGMNQAGIGTSQNLR